MGVIRPSQTIKQQSNQYHEANIGPPVFLWQKWEPQFRFERAWAPEEDSPWCSFFSPEDLHLYNFRWIELHYAPWTIHCTLLNTSNFIWQLAHSKVHRVLHVTPIWVLYATPHRVLHVTPHRVLHVTPNKVLHVTPYRVLHLQHKECYMLHHTECYMLHHTGCYVLHHK